MKQHPEEFDPVAWKRPPMAYRPVPFWMWNERQEPVELKRQIRQMHRQGFGGFFICGRLGLKTEYLSNEWFQHVRLCVDEARRRGMAAWIYDEYQWPSGYAGGQTAKTPGLDAAACGLVCRKGRRGRSTFEVIRSPGGSPNAHPWNSASGDPDLLNPKVAAAFLKLTHERYRRHIGRHFGQSVPGFFTDELSFVLWGREDRSQAVPWTQDLEAVFQRQRGYCLRPHLECLFADTGDYRRVRVDFYRTVTELLRDSYTKRLFDWCGRHGLASTGHLMMEETLLSQVQAVGAAMPHYEYFQVPGIDQLGRHMPDSPLWIKQCVSVARQLGRRRVLSEAFGGAGWETPLGQLKPLGDYQFALGINLLNQHLAYYSIRGRRKRDYPNSCSYHQPGYELYKPFNDYFSRLSYALSQGRPVCRILVLHPIASAWALYRPGHSEPVQTLDRQLAELSRRLLECQRDFDYGDELLMERHARVVNGQWVIGQMAYDVVIVPPAETWSRHTFNLLKQFTAQGGKVIAVGRPARFLDGRGSPDLTRFLAGPSVIRIPHATPFALDKALAFLPHAIEVRDEKGQRVSELVYQHRRDGRRDLYFLTFGHRKKAFRATIRLAGDGTVQRLDPETGAMVPLPCRREEGGIRAAVDIPAQGACLLLKEDGAAKLASFAIPHSPEVRRSLDGPWQVTRQGPNVLLVDRCRIRCLDSDWSESLLIQGGFGTGNLTNVQDLLQAAFEQRRLSPDWPVEWRLEFKVDTAVNETLDPWLVAENPEVFTRMEANGQALTAWKPAGWLDRQYRRVCLNSILRRGENRIDGRFFWASPTQPGTGKFTPKGVELENAYILGNFHVAWVGTEPRLIAARPLPTDPRADLARHGLPFYVGVIRYEKKFVLPRGSRPACCRIRFPRPNGEGLRLSVNGHAAGLLWAEPFTVDCTALVRPGLNYLQADLFTNLGNVLGPLHHRSPWLDPGHFFRSFQLRPVGLGGIPELIIHEETQP